MSRLLAYLRLALFNLFAWLFARLLRWAVKRAMRNMPMPEAARQRPTATAGGDFIEGEFRREGAAPLPRN